MCRIEYSHSRAEVDLMKISLYETFARLYSYYESSRVPHCKTPISDGVRICLGCGAEIVSGASQRERSLMGAVFVIAAMVIAVVVFRALEIARGVTPLSSPKAEDGFLFFVGFIAVVVVPYIHGNWRCPHALAFSHSLYRTYQHQ
jgi:predicted nucleic acid-binding Zn ribbon protein